MLSLIGLGLEKGDISIRAMDCLKNADVILIERYTLPTPKEYVDYLEKETGKSIHEITRSSLEDEVKTTLEQAQNYKLAILVSGDPLIATTHHIILEAARKMGIETEVYHAPSIFTAAIGESGLDIYKFGPTATIPSWSEKYEPTSFLEIIDRNLKNSQHTLVLLDVDPINKRTLSVEEAIEILKKADERKDYGLFENETKILILCDISSEKQKIVYCDINDSRIGEALSSETRRTALIIPSGLSFAEEELVSAFKL